MTLNLDSASLQFVGFGLATALLANLKDSAAWRHGVVLAASLVFLALLGHRVAILLPLLSFLALGYLGLILIRRKVPKATLVSVLCILLMFMWLKRYTFLPEAAFLPYVYLTVGLSYIFFRVLHLLIESGQDEEWPLVPVASYLRYTLNFTTLVSGPIQRFADFQSDAPALTVEVVAAQLERIVVGFFKVNVLGMLLYALQQHAFGRLAHPGAPATQWIAAFELAVVYPFFLYANFSGYIDIVIAVARLLRMELPENFDRPFSASSFLEFWSRWHITLSLWLKTYVYNSLLVAMMRRIPGRGLQNYLGVLCFFVTFFLVGIWHGRTSEFVVFGILQGGGVAINKLWQVTLIDALGGKRYRALAKTDGYTILGRGLTFSWFAFTLFWFWGNWQQIHLIFGAISAPAWAGVWLTVWLAAAVVLSGWEQLRRLTLGSGAGRDPILAHRYVRVAFASTLALVAFAIVVLLSQAAPDIVYKAF